MFPTANDATEAIEKYKTDMRAKFKSAWKEFMEPVRNKYKDENIPIETAKVQVLKLVKFLVDCKLNKKRSMLFDITELLSEPTGWDYLFSLKEIAEWNSRTSYHPLDIDPFDYTVSINGIHALEFFQSLISTSDAAAAATSSAALST